MDDKEKALENQIKAQKFGLTSSVTIPLEMWDALHQKIARLEKQVQEKTIVKEVYPFWYETLKAFAPFAIMLSLFLTFMILTHSR
jgi:hypothetical protein